MAKKVTIKDIADMAGVSIATVSHVINRTRYVSPDLVEKIENITKKIEVKGIIHFPNLTKNLAPIVLHTLKFNTIFKTTFITIPPTKSIFEYKFC